MARAVPCPASIRRRQSGSGPEPWRRLTSQGRGVGSKRGQPIAGRGQPARMDHVLPHITVAVCDAGEISRVGISRSLARHGIDVVAEAGDRATALQIARSGQAAVVLVDLGLPPALEAAFDVVAAANDAGSIPIAVGVDGARGGLFMCLRSGAAGYLTKDL